MNKPPTPLHRIWFAWLELRNRLDYPLRQWFRLQRGGLDFRNEPKSDLFARLPPSAQELAEQTASRLRQEYHLEGLYRRSSVDLYLENLYYLEMLESALERAGVSFPDPVFAADIGPSSWFYVQALFALLTYWRCPQGRAADLSGFEIDAFRIYTDFRSRFDHAQAHLRGLTRAHYYARAFERQPDAYHAIFLLFPFVFPRDHLEWGLPGPLFKPQALLRDAWESLKAGGILTIVNQGRAEYEAQAELLEGMHVAPSWHGEHTSLLYRYELPRFTFVCLKR